ncbi:hypothetical protein, partial [Gallibacterium anatis]|uniref:hypothetical protein n=1 Tax=Gallibacterium anatis TaxID=750 RepID=UPI00057F4D24
KTISENDRWHHYLKGKAREKRQSKKTTPFLSNDFGKMGLSAVWHIGNNMRFLFCAMPPNYLKVFDGSAR